MINVLLKSRSLPLALLVICGFFIFKLNHLSIPYFWDELGVYTKAAFYMYDHGITLLPGVIPDDLSRGHPLLCAAIFGTMFKFFGPNVWVGHLTAILFSCGLLWFTYKLGDIVGGHWTGIWACLILAIQPIFIAQSSMVLPEIMLAFFCVGALYEYLCRRYLTFALLGIFAIMTKETAVSLSAAIVTIEFVSTLISRQVSRQTVFSVIAAITPLVVWGLFLVAQKMTYGWFFFPLHSDYVSFAFNDIYPRIGYYLSFLFKGQGRYGWTLICLVWLLFFFVRCVNWRNISIFPFLKGVIERKDNWYILCVYCTFGLIVSALNFHLARYMLFVIPAVSVLVVWSLVNLVNQSMINSVLFPIILALPVFYYSSDIFNVDADMGYLNSVKVQSEASNYINENFSEDKTVVSHFPFSNGLEDIRAGYSNIEYKNIVSKCNNDGSVDADVYIYTHPGNLDYCSPDKKKLVLLKKYEQSFAKTLVYTKKKD